MSEPLQSAAGAAVSGALEAVADPLIKLIKSKPWRQSLTIQGAGVTALAGSIVAYGPDVLAAFHTPADLSAEIVKAAAGVLAFAGSAMALIGRFRAGGLH